MLREAGADHRPRVIGALLGVPEHEQSVLAVGGVTEADGALAPGQLFYRGDQVVGQFSHLGFTRRDRSGNERVERA